jgi:hypothetical protein
MTEKPITDLRRRMLQDMTNCNFGSHRLRLGLRLNWVD